MEAVVTKIVDRETGAIVIDGQGPERLKKLYAAGLLTREAEADAAAMLKRERALRRELELSRAEARRKGASLSRYRKERLQYFEEDTRRWELKLKRRAWRRQPEAREAAIGWCMAGIALGASIITIAAAMLI